jgi:hypothetical protein
MRIVDEADKPVTTVVAGAQGLRHVVDVENISTMPRSARVVAELPNGNRRLAFQPERRHTEEWDKFVEGIPQRESRLIECALIWRKGPTSSEEPIQCSRIFERRGAMEWIELKTDRLPFQITVRVE